MTEFLVLQSKTELRMISNFIINKNELRNDIYIKKVELKPNCK